MNDLTKIDQLEKECDSHSNVNDKIKLLERIVKITDKYSMEPDLNYRHSGNQEDIHILAGRRADNLLKLIKIYETEHCKAVKQRNHGKEKLIEEKIHKLNQKRDEAEIKCKEPW